MRHYKEQRGQLTFEQVKPIADKIVMMPSCRRAVFDYYVHGKAVKDLKVNSSLVIPYLQDVYIKFIAGSLDDYRHRFLYSNDFNPSAKVVGL